LVVIGSTTVVEGSFTPTHTSPPDGLGTWSAPDPKQAPSNLLDPHTPVVVLEETTGWAHVRCSNGWEAWVDAVKLVAIAPAEFTATHTVSTTAVDARARPDLAQPVVARLDPALPVQVINEWGDWTKVRCANDWEAWVDGRGLTRNAGRATAVAGAPPPLAIWLPIAGAAVAALGSFLPWYSGGGQSVTAWDIPIVGLITLEGDDSGLKTGLVLLVLLLAAVPVVIQSPLPVWAAGALAAVAVVIALLGFRLYLDAPEPRPDLGIGLILVLLGGITMAVAPFLSAGQSRP
jgi:SH3-like domain-containing protein